MAGTDWRSETIERIRSLIHDTDPEVYKDKVKLTFFNGASLDDPSHLFNASLDAGTRRAIDIVEGAELDEQAFQALIRDAVAYNIDRATTKRRA